MKCTHKDLFPLNGLEWIGCFMTVFIFIFANAGGLAGGGTTLPCIMIFFRFDFKRTVALGNALIMVSGFLRYLMNAKYTHPYKTTPDGKPTGVLVDYSIAIVMLPLIIIGVAVGAALYIVLPAIIILIVLVVLLIGLVTVNGRKIYTECKQTPVLKTNTVGVELELPSVENRKAAVESSQLDKEEGGGSESPNEVKLDT